MTPEEEAILRHNKNHRIGDPTRVKWTAFLNQALALNYITVNEFTERMEAVQEATRMGEIWDAIHLGEWADGDIKRWTRDWSERREAGLEVKYGIRPEIVHAGPPGIGLIDVLVLTMIVSVMTVVVIVAVH